ncbi:MAG TPA: alpha/beta hydrolase [Clostridiales bacterium]|nr:alpha/beta hydrolase [Clostridiales bacterium]
MKIIKDITYDYFDACKLDLYLPKSNDFSLLVYFHGGGLEIGDKSFDINVYKYLISSGIAVAAANYRMYPDAKYPEFIEDAASAVNWVFRNIENYGHCNNIFIAGSSAGAYLSMMLCFDKKYLGKYGINPNDIAGYIFDAGQPATHFNILKERGLDTRRVIIDEAAPIYHIGENQIQSPMMILVAEHDIPNRLEQTYLLCSTLKIFGYDEKKLIFKLMKGYQHVEYTNAFDVNNNNVFAVMIRDFIRSIE